MTLTQRVNNDTSFVNGFVSWRETYYEIVQALTLESRKDSPTGIVKTTIDSEGHAGLYTLAAMLTDKFENLNEGRPWDGEFLDEIDAFTARELSEDPENALLEDVKNTILHATDLEDIQRAFRLQFGMKIPLLHATDSDGATSIKSEGLHPVVNGKNRKDWSDSHCFYMQVGKSTYTSDERPIVLKSMVPLPFLSSHAYADLDGVSISDDEIREKYGVDISGLNTDTRDFISAFVDNDCKLMGLELLFREETTPTIEADNITVEAG